METNNIQEFEINKNVFDIIYTSESMEDYVLSHHVKNNKDILLQNIKSNTVLHFLETPGTQLKIIIFNDPTLEDKDNKIPIIIAHNIYSNETIKIEGLGNHFIAFLKTIKHANNIKKEQNNSITTTENLTHSFIQKTNKNIFPDYYTSKGVGEYRTIDNFNKPLEVHITVLDKNGYEKPSKCTKPETSLNNNIFIQMEKLIKWVNSKDFKEGDILKNIAKFHTRFIQIHPFLDGNGRTARLLTNYLLYLNNLPFLAINKSERINYLMSLSYALAKNDEDFEYDWEAFKKEYKNIINTYGKINNTRDDKRFTPLITLFNKYLSHENNKAIINILNYNGDSEYNGNHKFSANQIYNEINTENTK